MRPGPSRRGGQGFLPSLSAALLGLAGPLLATSQTASDDAPVVQYRIDVRVDVAAKSLAGQEVLVWRNPSQETVAELWFHLYWNAFVNNRSTHLWESRGSLRGGGTVEDGWGWQRPTAIRVRGIDHLSKLEWRSPDDGRPEDRTVFAIPLESPVLPGESVEIAIDWDARIPRVRRRTGQKEDFLFIAQWFPKIGVYEPGRGWNCHQFHASTEFYADYGTYDVTIDLPIEYAERVGGSGVQVGQPALDREAGRVRTRFLAPSREDRSRVDATGKRALVHDFAWTADPDYVVRKGTFYFDEWAQQYPAEIARVARATGKDASEIRQRDVRVTVFVHPEHADQWERHFDATCATLFFYGLWFGEYPYEHVTAVDPAWGGGAAGGMEYPTLFTCGTRMFTDVAMHSPESVTVHECGHQFWYGLVGNNEFEAAWMDEGFNSFADSEALLRRYGLQRGATWYAGLPAWGVRPTELPGGGAHGDLLTAQRIELGDLFGLLEGRADLVLEPLASSAFVDWWRDQPWLTFVEERTDPRWSDWRRYVEDGHDDPIRRAGWEYVDSQSYRTNSYPKPAVVLRSLPALVGEDAFVRGMRHYSETWRYGHPYPDDFVRTFHEGAGTDVTWYFDALLGTNDWIDWSVEVSQRPIPEPMGWFEEPDGQLALVERDRDADGDRGAGTNGDGEQEQEDDGEDGERGLRRYDVVLHKRGGLALPVAVRVDFADGRQRDFQWTREQQLEASWWRLPLEPGREKIERVRIDPERLWWLDENLSDNQWLDQDEGDHLAPLRWTERVLSQYSHLLHFFSSTGG